mmetsp:Transcript_35185/g.106096  ORF Transcript_35185/g.106096 Transcript_35185/m.106096 type:complete len:241 (+) Transcript_35185:30-752(+)
MRKDRVCHVVFANPTKLAAKAVAQCCRSCANPVGGGEAGAIAAIPRRPHFLPQSVQIADVVDDRRRPSFIQPPRNTIKLGSMPDGDQALGHAGKVPRAVVCVAPSDGFGLEAAEITQHRVDQPLGLFLCGHRCRCLQKGREELLAQSNAIVITATAAVCSGRVRPAAVQGWPPLIRGGGGQGRCWWCRGRGRGCGRHCSCYACGAVSPARQPDLDASPPTLQPWGSPRDGSCRSDGRQPG